MCEVNKYRVWLPDGYGAGKWAAVVELNDYAALEAELAKLKGEYEWVASINTALDESNQSAWAENAKLRAELERRESDVWKLAVYNVAGYAHLYTSGVGTILEIKAEVARLNGSKTNEQ